MKFHKSKIGLIVAVATLAGACVPAEAAKLQNVKINTSYANQISLDFVFDGQVGNYTDKLRYHPDELVLEIPDSESGLARNTVDVLRHGVKKIDVANLGDNLLINVGLEELKPYQISQQGNTLKVMVGESGKVTAAKMNAAPSVLPSAAGASSSINTVTKVDFQKHGSEGGVVAVSLDNNSAAVDVHPRGNHLIATFHSTDVQANQLTSMDLSDFGTPLKKVRVTREGGNAIVDITYDGKVDYKYTQNGRQVVISVNKQVVKQEELPKYTGKPISLNFQEISIRSVLQILADFNNFNLVTTDSVTGNITLRLDNVPWEQALETVLRVKGLDKRLEGNILLVAKAEELANLEKTKLEGKKKVEELAPLTTEFIQVNYAKASDLATLIGGLSHRVATTNDGPNNEAANQSILSPRGSVAVDARTNTLIVKDLPDNVDRIIDLVERLDVPVKQVQIEARIVSINNASTDELGINWSYSRTSGASASKGFSPTSNTLPADGKGDGKDPYGNFASTGHYSAHVNTALPIATQGIGIEIGKWFGDDLLDMYLSALETESKGEIISSPRVTTSNQKAAKIQQGTEIPTNVSTSSGATSVDWKEAVLGLEVTPQITPDNSIILDLKVTQDTPGDTVATGTGTAQEINTKSVETQVLVGNGETIVLGGIYQQQITKSVSKVPILGDIPYLGRLFKYTRDDSRRQELLIFVTPKIVEIKR